MYKPEKIQNRKYLLSLDLLKGTAVLFMVIGHSIQWWNRSLANNYESSSFPIFIIISIGLIVFPLFLFIYGFNQANSLLHRSTAEEKGRIRNRVLRRAAIFTLLASLGQFVMWFVRTFPNLDLYILPRYLVHWHLFHFFAVIPVFFYFLWEITTYLNKIFIKQEISKIFTLVCILSALLVLLLFFIFHDYTLNRPIIFPVEFNAFSILEHIILDIGSAGLIPWLIFPLLGGISATFLNISSNITNNKAFRVKLLILGGVSLIILCIGLFSLSFERYSSPALVTPSTFSHVFISSGTILFLLCVLLFFIDFGTWENFFIVKQIAIPLQLLSNLSLTIFFVHPVIFGLNPALIPSESLFLALATFYALLFIPISFLWQKFYYRFSLEWLIRQYS